MRFSENCVLLVMSAIIDGLKPPIEIRIQVELECIVNMLEEIHFLETSLDRRLSA
jgi:hypothetical protein